MNKFFLFLTVAMCIFMSCKEKEENPAMAKFDARMQETIDLHDEVMPKMSQLMALRSELNKLQDSANAEKVETLKQGLGDAHSGMMDWMEDYSDKFPHGEPVPEEEVAEKMPMLEQEYEEIKDLKEETDLAIEEAQTFIDSRS